MLLRTLVVPFEYAKRPIAVGIAVGLAVAGLGAFGTVRLASALHAFWRVGVGIGALLTVVAAIAMGLYAGLWTAWGEPRR